MESFNILIQISEDDLQKIALQYILKGIYLAMKMQSKYIIIEITLQKYEF